MIISPPFLRDKEATQSDADWIEAMMPVNARRGYPLNASESWHGGIHISHTDAGTTPEKVRAIADGTVVSFRKPSPPEKRDQFPLKYAPVRGTDDGYVLLKHETEIGSGEDSKVVFYSLYMHLKFLEAEIKADAKIYRKDPIGSSGMTDGQNEFHFQIFCDVIEKIMVANTKAMAKLQISKISKKVTEYYCDINTILNKYNLYSTNRKCHFLGQGAVESGSLLLMQGISQQQRIENGVHKGGGVVDLSTKNEAELGHWYGELTEEKDDYFSGKKYNSKGNVITRSYSWINGNCGDVDAQKYRGRGFKMLTGLDTYSSYWVYRGWLSVSDFDRYWWDDPEYKKKNVAKMKKHSPQIDSPQKLTESTYNCIDTGGFFIVGFKGKTVKIMDGDKNGKADDDQIIEDVTSEINDADKGLAEREIFTKRAKEVIGDDI